MTPATFLDALVLNCASHGLLVDTNVLLMYLVGSYDPGYIGLFKRTQQYSTEDFQIVRGLAHRFRRLVTTPHILSELTNLSRGVHEPRLSKYFRCLIGVLRRAHEVHVHKDVLLSHARLPRFGFTDLSILEAAKRSKYLVLTDDFAAAGILRAERCDVINLNHLRQLYW